MKILVVCGSDGCSELVGCMKEYSALIKNCAQQCGRQQFFECTFQLDIVLDKKNTILFRKVMGISCKYCPDSRVSLEDDESGPVAVLS